MDGTIFQGRANSRVDGVVRLTEEIMGDHREAMFACDVQDFVAELLDHVTLLRQLWQESKQRAAEGTLVDFHGHGEYLLTLFKRSLPAYETAVPLIVQAKKLGHTIEGERAFRVGHSELREMRRHIERHWPFVRTDHMSEAHDAFLRGDTQSPEDIINEIRRAGSHAGEGEGCEVGIAD